MQSQLIYKGLANYFKNYEGIGGKLYLYSDKLVHKPHSINVQTQETIINLNDIVNVSTRNTAKIIPNGLLVQTKDGKEHKFVVYKRTKWVEYIQQVTQPK